MSARKFRYTSHKSSLRWPLKDEHWIALEQAGWRVQWVRDMPEKEKKILSFGMKDDRYLGALAFTATREGLCRCEARDEWEHITKQSIDGYWSQGSHELEVED